MLLLLVCVVWFNVHRGPKGNRCNDGYSNKRLLVRVHHLQFGTRTQHFLHQSLLFLCVCLLNFHLTLISNIFFSIINTSAMPCHVFKVFRLFFFSLSCFFFGACLFQPIHLFFPFEFSIRVKILFQFLPKLTAKQPFLKEEQKKHVFRRFFFRRRASSLYR